MNLHIPVLLKETIELLQPSPNNNFIDGTLGHGGYSKEILKKTGPKGKLLGIDLDKGAINQSKKRLSLFGSRVIFVQDNFKNIKKIAEDNDFFSVHGVVVDLGFSRGELEDESRGISFLKEAPLDMRFNQGDESIETAADIINTYSEDKLKKIFQEYGEERFSGRIAGAITAQRKQQSIKTTTELVDIIKSVIPKKYAKGKIHPATRVFQALRIAVNKELDNLQEFLPQAVDILEKEGRLAVVSFHSLEDRIVKRFFKKESIDCICPKEIPVCRCDHKASIKIINKKVIKPSEEEIKINPWSRSAKLRIVEKI